MKPLTLEETGIKTDDNEMCIKGIDELPIFSWNTKTKEFYVLGHKFDGVNSIEDFINYIHNLDKENKQLKADLEMYENGVYFSSENDKLQNEIDNLNHIIDKQDKDITILSKGNKHLKEVIDKLKNNIENDIDGFRTINEFGESQAILELLDIYLGILKEVK